MSARITRFGSPLEGPSRRIDVRLGRDSALPVQLTVEGASDAVRAQLWTNANHNAQPERYEVVELRRRVEEGRTLFEGELPVAHIGNYRFTARLQEAGVTSWASEQGFPDFLYRVRPTCIDALEIETVSIHNLNWVSRDQPGTFADLLESGSPSTNGRYTLEWLADLGKNCLWLLPIFEVSSARRVDPGDDLPSPYAVKNFFQVRRSLSRAARGRQGEAAEQAAKEEFLAFAARAHELGIKLVLDLPLNHLGLEHAFSDLIGERREVRANDFSRLELPAERRDELAARLADPRYPRSLEELAPWLYGSLRGDPRGARDVSQIAPGGWFEWPDTLQLNHGRQRVGFHEFRDFPPAPEHRAVRDWLERVLSFWAVEMGVDGFRMDHMSGLHPGFLEHTFNRVQADVDRLRPGGEVLIIGEDFDTPWLTQHWVDALQCGWAQDLVEVRSASALRKILEHPIFWHLLNVSSHDEDRLFRRLRHDPKAAERLGCLLHLLGGPVMEVAGDCFGERDRLPVRRLAPLTALPLSADASRLHDLFARCLRARRRFPALQGRDRVWLCTLAGDREEELLALARGDLLLFCNFNDRLERSQVFALDDATLGRLPPEDPCQPIDLLADNPIPLGPPRTRDDLARGGLFVKLAPYQLQLLRLGSSKGGPAALETRETLIPEE